MHRHVLDLHAASQRTGIPPAVLRRRAFDGDVPATRIGGHWRFWHPALVLHLVGPEAAAMLEETLGEDCEPEVVTTKELSRLLGLPERSLAVLLREGALPGRKDKRRWRAYWPVIRLRLAAGEPLVQTPGPLIASAGLAEPAAGCPRHVGPL